MVYKILVFAAENEPPVKKNVQKIVLAHSIHQFIWQLTVSRLPLISPV